MEEQLVSFDTAKLAKERGFNVATNKCYEYSLTEQIDEETGETSGAFGWKKGELNLSSTYFVNGSNHDFSNDSWYMCSAPTQALLQKYLREKHNIEVIVLPQKLLYENKKIYHVLIDGHYLIKGIEKEIKFYTYEDALEYGLQYVLKSNNFIK